MSSKRTGDTLVYAIVGDEVEWDEYFEGARDAHNCSSRMPATIHDAMRLYLTKGTTTEIWSVVHRPNNMTRREWGDLDMKVLTEVDDFTAARSKQDGH